MPSSGPGEQENRPRSIEQKYGYDGLISPRLDRAGATFRPLKIHAPSNNISAISFSFQLERRVLEPKLTIISTDRPEP